MSPNQQVSKRSRRRFVSFSPNVNLRLICPPPPTSASEDSDEQAPVDPSWLYNYELDDMKSRAKNLSKMHYLIRTTKEICSPRQVEEVIDGEQAATKSRPTNSNATAIRHATRYEINGESLRGMEHLTEVNYGRKRRKVKEAAIQAAMDEQQKHQFENHLIRNYSASYSAIANHHQKKGGGTEVAQLQRKNKRKLAIVYRDKSQEALVCARQVADEDAKIAAEILAQDLLVPSYEQGVELREETSVSSSLSRGNSNSSSSVSTSSSGTPSSVLLESFSTKSSGIALTWLAFDTKQVQ